MYREFNLNLSVPNEILLKYVTVLSSLMSVAVSMLLWPSEVTVTKSTQYARPVVLSKGLLSPGWNS